MSIPTYTKADVDMLIDEVEASSESERCGGPSWKVDVNLLLALVNRLKDAERELAKAKP